MKRDCNLGACPRIDNLLRKGEFGHNSPDSRQIGQLFFSNHAKTCLKLPFPRYGSYSWTSSYERSLEQKIYYDKVEFGYLFT